MLTYNQYFQQIHEAKQVGLLYHLVSVRKLNYILKDNTLTPSKYQYISFTRNKNMWSYAGDDNPTYQIVIDGDKLSHNHRTEPFSYPELREMGFNEQEERVLGEIKNIKKYIVQINKISWKNIAKNNEFQCGGAFILNYVENNGKNNSHDNKRAKEFIDSLVKMDDMITSKGIKLNKL